MFPLVSYSTGKMKAAVRKLPQMPFTAAPHLPASGSIYSAVLPLTIDKVSIIPFKAHPSTCTLNSTSFIHLRTTLQNLTFLTLSVWLTIASFLSVCKSAIVSPTVATLLFILFLLPASSAFLCCLLWQNSSKNCSIHIFPDYSLSILS